MSGGSYTDPNVTTRPTQQLNLPPISDIEGEEDWTRGGVDRGSIRVQTCIFIVYVLLVLNQGTT